MQNYVKKVTILYRKELASLFRLQKKLRACRNKKKTLSSGCFIAGDCHIKIICLHILVFNEHTLHFWDNEACNFTKINTPPWVLFMFFNLYKLHQIAQRIPIYQKLSDESTSNLFWFVQMLKSNRNENVKIFSCPS